jgi:chromosome partitioning protein
VANLDLLIRIFYPHPRFRKKKRLNMSIVSIAMLKGGLGKTTTAINLGAALEQRGKKVLLIDADPQGNMSQALGIVEESPKNLFSELSKTIRGETGDLSESVIQTRCGLYLVPSSYELAGAELELVSVYGREQVLTWLLEKIRYQFDYIFIDCPPAIGMLTVNALVASDYVLIPMQAEFLPLKGLQTFLQHLKTIKRLNNRLEILGFVLTRYDERKVMNRQIFNLMEKEFGDKVFRTHIRSNIQLAKAQEAGTDIFHFDNHSHGARDYEDLAEEFQTKMNSN